MSKYTPENSYEEVVKVNVYEVMSYAKKLAGTNESYAKEPGINVTKLFADPESTRYCTDDDSLIKV